MRLVPAFAAIAVLCAAAPAAHAQLTPPFTHEGVFLRVEGAIGYLHADANFASNDATAYGGAGYLGFALGGAIGENLVLYGEIWGAAAANPTLQYGSATTTLNNQSLNYGGIGPGLGYFIMPANVFLGVGLDFTRLGITNSNGDSTNSDVGLALNLTLGKQFWISDHWGLGVSLKGIGGGNKDDNNDNNSATFKTFTGLVALTLTYG